MTTTNFAWLIECGGSKADRPLYFSGMDTFGRFKWSFDHELAVRFSRRQDAAAVAGGDTLGTNHRVCEHGWDADDAADAADAIESLAGESAGG